MPYNRCGRVCTDRSWVDRWEQLTGTPPNIVAIRKRLYELGANKTGGERKRDTKGRYKNAKRE